MATKKVPYSRGHYWLDFDKGRDGSPRSPNYYIFRYDPARGRNVGTSTRTGDLQTASKALDSYYLSATGGPAICPACGNNIDVSQTTLVADAIADYMITAGDHRSSVQAIKARLAHVLDYLRSLPNSAVVCADVDEQWIEAMRRWLADKPIVAYLKNGLTGKTRKRSASTIENSVLQLAAAIRLATKQAPKFRARQPQNVNESPRYRATVNDLAKMLSWTMEPRNRGEALRRFIVFSVCTAARPDAAMSFSTSPDTMQWDSKFSLIYLRPQGRMQTDKKRPIVRCPQRLKPWLDNEIGQFVRNRRGPVADVSAAWDSMRRDLGLPTSGTKDIRRSMAVLIRGMASADDVELQMGHKVLSPSTSVYAPFAPDYLDTALAAIEHVIAEVEKTVPMAFHRDLTGMGDPDGEV